jgi:ABC-type Zn uptake system ZnuABC Zn-binding protein ZnuA
MIEVANITDKVAFPMKFFSLLLAVFLICLPLFGCAPAGETAQIAATTGFVYTFTTHLCQGTGLTVTQLVTDNVSCLHDYSLSVRQVRAAEAAEVVVLSGGGLEDFMADLLTGKNTIDCSRGISLQESCHDHDHSDHHHEADPHFWLSPASAKIMAENICIGLSAQYPALASQFAENLISLCAKLDKLQQYGETELASLKNRELITFHDGFSYFAEGFGLTILKAVEEESGSEASAAELKELITLAESHQISAIFTETNGSASAAQIISRETGIPIYTLNMAMTGDYFTAMYHNIDTIKEALG